MKTYYTNHTHAMQAKEAGTLHSTLKSANAEKREANKNSDLPHIVVRFVAPGQFGDDSFYGYYVCLDGDSHLTERRI